MYCVHRNSLTIKRYQIADVISIICNSRLYKFIVLKRSSSMNLKYITFLLCVSSMMLDDVVALKPFPNGGTPNQNTHMFANQAPIPGRIVGILCEKDNQLSFVQVTHFDMPRPPVPVIQNLNPLPPSLPVPFFNPQGPTAQKKEVRKQVKPQNNQINFNLQNWMSEKCSPSCSEIFNIERKVENALVKEKKMGESVGSSKPISPTLSEKTENRQIKQQKLISPPLYGKKETKQIKPSTKREDSDSETVDEIK